MKERKSGNVTDKSIEKVRVKKRESVCVRACACERVEQEREMDISQVLTLQCQKMQ